MTCANTTLMERAVASVRLWNPGRLPSALWIGPQVSPPPQFGMVIGALPSHWEPRSTPASSAAASVNPLNAEPVGRRPCHALLNVVSPFDRWVPYLTLPLAMT